LSKKTLPFLAKTAAGQVNIKEMEWTTGRRFSLRIKSPSYPRECRAEHMKAPPIIRPEFYTMILSKAWALKRCAILYGDI